MAGRAAKGQAAAGTRTVRCEWFPAEPSKEERPPDPWCQGEGRWRETEARLFGAALRTAFNRLPDGLTRATRDKVATPSVDGFATSEPAVAVETTAERAAALCLELKRRQIAFGLNRRYADNPIVKANEVVVSQRALIPVGIAATRANRERTERKRKANQRQVAPLEAAGHTEASATIGRVIHGHELRLARLNAKLAEHRWHRMQGTIPRVVFGDKRLWRRLHGSVGPKHARLRAQWRAPRTAVQPGGCQQGSGGRWTDEPGPSRPPASGSGPYWGMRAKDFTRW